MWHLWQEIQNHNTCEFCFKKIFDKKIFDTKIFEEDFWHKDFDNFNMKIFEKDFDTKIFVKDFWKRFWHKDFWRRFLTLRFLTQSFLKKIPDMKILDTKISEKDFEAKIFEKDFWHKGWKWILKNFNSLQNTAKMAPKYVNWWAYTSSIWWHQENLLSSNLHKLDYIAEYKQEILFTLLDGLRCLSWSLFALLKEEGKQRLARKTSANHAI